MIEILICSILILLYLIPFQYFIIEFILLHIENKSEYPMWLEFIILLFTLIPLLNYIFLFAIPSSYRRKLMSGRNDIVKCRNCNIYTRRFYVINKNPIWKENRWDDDGYENITDKAKCPFCNNDNLMDIEKLNVTELPFGEKVPYFKALFNELFKFKTKQYKMDKLEEERQTLQNTLNLIQQQSEAMDKFLEKQRLNKWNIGGM